MLPEDGAPLPLSPALPAQCDPEDLKLDFDKDGEITYKDPGCNPLPFLRGVETTPIPKGRIPYNQGICPIPPQSQIDKYIAGYKQIIKEGVGKLHTNDRLNWEAMFEILVDQENVIKNQTWADTVTTNFENSYWPFIQSNQTRTCVSIAIFESPDNMFKMQGSKFLAMSAALLGLVWLY